MAERTAFDARLDKRSFLKQKEAAGEIADSTEVRMKLVQMMNSGEITLEEGQRRLSEIQRNAKKQGKLTRAQAYNMG